MNCKKCDTKLSNNSKFCGKCGAEVLTPESTEFLQKEQSTLSQKDNSNPVIKCGNCGYEGSGEPARSIGGKILAWLCVLFAPMITIIYFVATHKWRCPKCKSTFLGVRNEHGVFVGQSGGGSRILIVLICIIVGIAIIGILASVVLASLNSARQKGIDASIKASLSNARAQAELYYDQNGNSYQGVCSSAEGIISMKINASEVSGKNVICNDSAKSWAMSSALKSVSTSWCVDNTGTAKEISWDIGNQTHCSDNSSQSNINNDSVFSGDQVCARDLPNSTWDGKSYTSNGNYECSCKKGYEPNVAGDACVTPDQNCNTQFPNTHSTNNNTCDCNIGYTWDAKQTGCY